MLNLWSRWKGRAFNWSSQILVDVQERRVPKSWQRAADKTAAKVDSSTSSDQVPAAT